VVAVEVGRPEQLPPSSEELEKLRAALAEERDARLKMEKELASMRQLLDRQHRGLKSQATAIGALKGTTSRLSTTLEATSDELRRLKRKRARTDRGTDEGA
jgi:chromosome segregation ATPase